MLYIDTLMTIAGVVLLGSASPGPNFIIVSSNSLYSRSNGLWAALGVSAGSLSWAFLGVSGIAFMLNKFQWLDQVFSLLGGMYLIYMGFNIVRTLNSNSISESRNTECSKEKWKAFKSGYLVNMANPKTIIFVSSFFIAIIPTSAPMVISYLAVLVAGITSFFWYSSVAFILSSKRAKKIYLSYSKYINILLAILLIVLGIKLIWQIFL